MTSLGIKIWEIVNADNMTKHDRITPQYITSLREGEIFVFGSVIRKACTVVEQHASPMKSSAQNGASVSA